MTQAYLRPVGWQRLAYVLNDMGLSRWDSLETKLQRLMFLPHGYLSFSSPIFNLVEAVDSKNQVGKSPISCLPTSDLPKPVPLGYRSSQQDMCP